MSRHHANSSDIKADTVDAEKVLVSNGTASEPSIAFREHPTCGWRFNPLTNRVEEYIHGALVRNTGPSSGIIGETIVNNILQRVGISANASNALQIQGTPASNTISLRVACSSAANSGSVNTANLLPLVNNTFDIGSSSMRYKDIYATLPSAITANQVFYDTTTGKLSYGAGGAPKTLYSVYMINPLNNSHGNGTGVVLFFNNFTTSINSLQNGDTWALGAFTSALGGDYEVNIRVGCSNPAGNTSCKLSIFNSVNRDLDTCNPVNVATVGPIINEWTMSGTHVFNLTAGQNVSFVVNSFNGTQNCNIVANHTYMTIRQL
jgi:hypothetical protein